MASAESIGACSLDPEAPSQSPRCARVLEAASAITLHSAVMSEEGSPAAGTDQVDQAGMRFRSDALLYLSPHGKAIQLVSEEHSSLPLQGDGSRLPSYLGISCAISGYSSYSRFCHSRENSPARISPLKPLSLPQSSGNLNFDYLSSKSQAVSDRLTSATSLSPRQLSAESRRTPRENYLNSNLGSTKDSYICNRYFKSPSPEKRFVTSQNIVLNVNGSAGLVNGGSVPKANGVHMNGHGHAEGMVNGTEKATNHDWPNKDKNGKSLVEQRIESLFGRPAAHVTQYPTRMSRSKTRVTIDPTTAKRSPSCPPQAFRGISQESPPVFRRIAPDFKEQLRNSPAPDTSGLSKPWLEPPTKNGTLQTVQSPSSKQPASPASQPVAALECTQEAVVESVPTTSLPDPPTNGHGYLQKLEDERRKISDEMAEAELILSEPDLTEEASGKVRSAIGKANLLLTSKMEQFRGLCNKNINPVVLAEGEFPTTAEDLAGFWDMVLLQVDDVRATFQRIRELKCNHWKDDNTPVPYDSAPKPRRQVSANRGRARSNPTTPEHQTSKEAAKSRDAQRRLLLEAKRKGRKQQTQQSPAATDGAEVEIFSPSSAE